MAVGDAYVFPGFLTPVLTQISFQSHRLLFSHTSAEMRGGNTPERNFASSGSQTQKPPGHESDMSQDCVVRSYKLIYTRKF